MFKKIILLLLIVGLMPSFSGAKQIADINIPDTIKEGKNILILNGAGIRIWQMDSSNLYVCGLYLLKKSSDANTVKNADEPMAIKIHVLSKFVTNEDFLSAIRDLLKISTGGNTAPIEDRIKAFEDGFKGKMEVNIVYDFVYIPKGGVKIYRNGKLTSSVKGLDFKKPFFGIWLGSKPVQESLKKAMLGM
jgi:hypothetical protein